LPEAMHAADSLLDAHRVPRQVVVDDDVRELEVASLAARLGRDQERDRAAEALERLLLLLPRLLAVEHLVRNALGGEGLRDLVLARAELREHDRLVVEALE